jgi:flagellin
MLSIQTNIGSLNAQRNLMTTTNQLQTSMARLSSGFRITKAGDDAAGLAVSSNLQAQIRSYSQASRNAADGVSLSQTAEGSLNEVTNILTRMRELAMQSASDGIGSTERGYVNSENQQLTSELDRISATTEYNGTKLLDGSVTQLQFQVGIRATANDSITVGLTKTDTTSLAVNGNDLSTVTGATTALAAIDAALVTVSQTRASFGAVGNRLSSVMNTIQVASESLSSANSRIRDVDVAEETSAMTRANVLQQAGVSVLSQANQSPQIALKLLG